MWRSWVRILIGWAEISKLHTQKQHVHLVLFGTSRNTLQGLCRIPTENAVENYFIANRSIPPKLDYMDDRSHKLNWLVPVPGVAIRNDFLQIIPTKNTHRAL